MKPGRAPRSTLPVATSGSTPVLARRILPPTTTRQSGALTVEISGTEVLVDPFAFAVPGTSGTPELKHLGVSINGATILGIDDVPDALGLPFLRLFKAVQTNNPIEDACAEILNGLAAFSAKTINAHEPIKSIPSYGEYIRINSTIGPRGIVDAMNHAGKNSRKRWKPNEQNRMAYQYLQPQGSVEVSIDSVASEAYAVLKKLSDDKTIDIFLIFLEHHIERKNKNGCAEILAATVFDERCIKPKMGGNGIKSYSEGHRREDYQDIDDRVQQLEKLWIKAREVKFFDAAAKGKRRTITQESRCLIITERVSEMRDDAVPPRIIGWRYTLGDALKALGSDKQFTYLAKKSLKYDPYREKAEKRLARNFAFLHRIQKGEPVRYALSTIVDQCGIEIDARNPQRTRDRLEAALDRLAADGVIGAWRYCAKQGSLPARNWLPRWLQWSIEVAIADANPMLRQPQKPAKKLAEASNG